MATGHVGGRVDVRGVSLTEGGRERGVKGGETARGAGQGFILADSERDMTPVGEETD